MSQIFNTSIDVKGNILSGGIISKVGGTSTQFLKANGSVDSNTYTPTNGTGASGTWGISITGNAATATTLQTARTINGSSFNGSANIDTTEWFHSDRDFPNGTLITTNINYAVSSGDPFVLEIRGNSYGNIIPLDLLYQGYIYADTIINHGGISNGLNITGLVAINNGGNLCFWFPSQGYWNGYNVKVYTAYNATRAVNRVTSISGVVKPTTTKEVALSDNIRQSLHSSNYNSYSPTLTGGGASGTWGINITGNAATATTLQTARTLTIGNTGKSFDGSGNVSWSLAEIGVQSILTNPITGTGTTNYLPKFTSAGVLGNSQIFDNGSRVWIGGTDNGEDKLQVNGSGFIKGLHINKELQRINSALPSGGLVITGLNDGNFALTMGTDGTKFPYIQSTNYTTNIGGYALLINPNGGNVLIGTTTDNGVDKLQVNGTASFSSSLKVGQNTNDNGARIIVNGRLTGRNYQLANAWNGSYFEITPSTLNGGDVFTTPSFVISDTQNVLIGTTTDNGADKLQVNGSVRIGTKLSIGAASAVAGAYQSLEFNAGVYSKAQIRGYSESTSDAGALAFLTAPDGDLVQERMRINSSGNVLIGTTIDNGVDKLQVNGSISGKGINVFSSYGLLRINIGTDGTMLWGANADYGTLSWDVGKTIVYANAGKDLILGANGNQSFLTIKQNGNILIGTTTDNGVDKLQVNGSISATSYTGSATLTGTPTAPTAAQGTTGNQIATLDYVLATRPYKVYTALVNQAGTSNPTATVLENTFGETPTLSRIGAGVYTINTTGNMFTANKTFFTVHGVSNRQYCILMYRTSTTQCTIYLQNISTGTGTDNVITTSDGASIEIRVYN